MFASIKARLAARRENGEKGFTLIELLVAVTLISILGAIGTAVIINQTDKARDAAVRAELTSVRDYIKGGLVASDPQVVTAFKAGSAAVAPVPASNGAAVWEKPDFKFSVNDEGTKICVQFTDGGKTYAMDAAEAVKTSGAVQSAKACAAGGVLA